MSPESCPSCGFLLAAARTPEQCPACGRSRRRGMLRRVLDSLFSSPHDPGSPGRTRMPEPSPRAAARPAAKEAHAGPGVIHRERTRTTHTAASREELAPVLRAVVAALMAGGGMRRLLGALLGSWSGQWTRRGGVVTMRSEEVTDELPADVRARIETLLADTAAPGSPGPSRDAERGERRENAEEELPAEIRAILDRIRKS